MSVYVDNMAAPYGRMIMSHMAADTTEELLQMADKIGVARKWLQHPGTWKEHFDVCKEKKELAIQHGAKQITMYELVKMQSKRRKP